VRAVSNNWKLKTTILTSANNFQGPASRRRVFTFFPRPNQNIRQKCRSQIEKKKKLDFDYKNPVVQFLCVCVFFNFQFSLSEKKMRVISSKVMTHKKKNENLLTCLSCSHATAGGRTQREPSNFIREAALYILFFSQM
jgi:hypothetical protein